jgi:hypothetical protein
MTTHTADFAFVAPADATIYIDDALAIVTAAAAIGDRPASEHVALLALLVAALERAGVDVPEVWRCALDELASGEG